jgi:hypothetical protein
MYFDMYHGYQEWEAGFEASTEYLRNIVENLKEHTDGRPVHYLGQQHSINNNFTPSKQSILGHLQAALEAGVDGFGWYERGNFRETSSRNYAPFIPAVGDVVDEQWNSFTGARDRYLYATLAMLEQTRGIDAADTFDLWVYGHDMELWDHAVSVRTADGEWEYVGDVSGYADGENPYSGGGRDRAHVFRGLDRERFLGEELAVRVDTHDDGDGATLHGVYAMPYLDTSHFRTEGEVTDLLAEGGVADCALAAVDSGATLQAGGTVTVEAAVAEPAAALTERVRPTHREELDRLADLESEREFSPQDYLDLWLYGSSLDDVSVYLSGTELDEYSGAVEVDEAVVFRGLEREAFVEEHTAGRYLDLGIAAEGSATLEAAYAMPYHGTANLTTDAEAAERIRRDHAEGEGTINTFSLGHHAWVGGRDLSAGDRVNPWVHLPERTIVTRPDTPHHNQAYGWWE